MNMVRSIVLIVLLLAASAAGKRNFDDYKVFRVIPSSSEQLELLKRLQHQREGYSYWIEPRRVFDAADIMVSPSQLVEFVKLMDAADMRYATYIEDVQSLIADEHLARDSSLEFDWTRYHSLERIYDWLHNISLAYPNKVTVLDAGRTYEGRAIRGVKLSFGGGAEERPGVFIEGGIHAREWISPATVTYLVNAFLTSERPQVRKLAEAHDWYVFPVLNPDGYVYSHTSDRLWRKTRSRSNATECVGADPNRNWAFKWMQGGASEDPCDNHYGGSHAFSERETRSMSEYVRSIADKLFGYIAFHSYAQALMFPYGYTAEHLDNYDEEKSIALKAVNALARRYGTSYRSGTIYELMCLSSGSSLEWVKATLKLPLTFAYELRDQGNYGFILPARQILPNSEEVLESLMSMLAEAAQLGYPGSVHRP